MRRRRKGGGLRLPYKLSQWWIRFRRPFRVGPWLAWLLHDRCLSAPDVPTKRHLRWNTREVEQTQAEHYWSEGEHAGAAPCVESSLFRIEVRRYLGGPVVLWRVAIEIQVLVGDTPSGFTRDRSYGTEADARYEFELHQQKVRDCLGGETWPRGRAW